MSGVLRRGSLSFNCNLGETGSRGGSEYNLHGEGFCDAQLSRTPEISVLALDFKRLSQDLKKDFSPTPSSGTEIVEVYDGLDGDTKDLSQDVDSDVISNFIGHFRRWHFVWTLTLSFFQIPSTFHMFGFVFQTADKDFWCARPADLAHLDISAWRNLTQTHDACSLVDLTASDNKSACTQFEYSMDEGDGVTLVQEFDLVCDRQNLLSVVEMCFLAGAAVGSVSSGWLSDVFGRKHTLMGFALVQAVFGIVLTFSTSLAMFMTLRVIVGFASMTVVVVSFVLVVELVSGKWRTIIGILNILPVALAYILMAGIAYFVRDWRHLQVVISLPGWALLSIWYKLPESPRWLLARGRLNELYVLIERAARMNGTILPANYQKSLEAAVTKATPVATPAAAVVATERTDTTQPTPPSTTTTPATNPDSNKPEIDSDANPLVVVFNKQYWSTTCLTLIVWLTLIVIYFGLTLHLSNLGGNIYVNTVIAGSAEALSICLSIFVVLRLGIRRSLIVYMLIPGVCCLATNLVPKDSPVAVIALAMIAKCMIGANNAIIPTYTAMQYPTVVRNFGVGMGNLAAGVALILVPYMWLLAQVQPLLPLSVMGVCGIVGAVALMMMKDVK